MNDRNYNRKREEMLLRKYLSGTASESEIRQLRQLSESSVTLKRKLDDSDTIINQIEILKLMKTINTSSSLEKLKRRLGKYPAKKDWFFYWQKLAAFLLLPLLLFSVFQLFPRKDQLIDRRYPIEYNEISTSSGLRSVFQLPDGTKVWMNGSTKIKYPILFSKDERRIQLEGEAYFEIAKNEEKPFIIDFGTLHVEAVGTAFNCTAYPEDNLIETALTEGKIKVTRVFEGKKKEEYLVDVGQVISYQPNSGQFQLQEGNLDKYLSWRSGKFIFRNDPLEVVCQKLERWFNAEIVIKDESLKSYSFTGTFKEEGLTEIIELISLTSPICYKVSERKANEENEYETLKIEIMKK